MTNSEPRTPRDGDLSAVISKVAHGESLTATESEGAFASIMDGSASDIHISALLMGLRTKGHSASEVAGGVRALRGAMVAVDVGPIDGVIDTCGTGGGTLTTFNISTAAVFVAAGAGARIAKHGNRSFTSRSGSADVLEALGIPIQLPRVALETIAQETGIVFLFAPAHHPAMRHVGAVRRALGITTIMNVLGPLANPARVRRQMVGVADPALLPLVAAALKELGHVRALVVHGHPGMDEISPLGPTRVAELDEGQINETTITPEEFGLSGATAESLAGGSPDDNARTILDVLEGREQGGARAAVLMNAAGALYVAGRAASPAEGATLAGESIDSGAARTSLERFREASVRA
jgi:anthranilate phosphoribosyltransferase